MLLIRLDDVLFLLLGLEILTFLTYFSWMCIRCKSLIRNDMSLVTIYHRVSILFMVSALDLKRKYIQSCADYNTCED
jgi:hypothetical protein